MSKPWNNEKTPWVEKCDPCQYNWSGIRNLERRLRHAESILRWIDDKPISDIALILAKTREYLVAAQQEDKS